MHELSPEVKQALRALLGDDSPAPVSGGVDYEAICAKVKADLQPAIEMIGNELKALREENDQLKDIVFKMVTSFSDAVGSHRQQGLRSSLMEKYGSDIESIGGFYKDAYDSDITEDLLEALMGAEGDPMEMAGESLRTLKEKFGKYQRVEPSVEVEIETSSPQGELDLEPKAESQEGGEPSKPEEKQEGPPERASDKLFETVKELRRKTA